MAQRVSQIWGVEKPNINPTVNIASSLMQNPKTVNNYTGDYYLNKQIPQEDKQKPKARIGGKSRRKMRRTKKRKAKRTIKRRKHY